MKNHILILLLVLFFTTSHAQQNSTLSTEKVWRVNFLNPGVEIEVPTGNYSTFSAGLGIELVSAFLELSRGETYQSTLFVGLGTAISPYLDLQEKWFYNLDKRYNKDKTIENNSGNFISLRLLTRGQSISDNEVRSSNLDFAIQHTWGIQRKYGENFHLLFDLGYMYYFDTKGNGRFFPLTFQINLGLNLSQKR